MRDVRSKYCKFKATRVFVSVFRRKGRCGARHMHGWEKHLCQTFLFCSGDGGGDGGMVKLTSVLQVKTDSARLPKNTIVCLTWSYYSVHCEFFTFTDSEHHGRTCKLLVRYRM